MKRGVSINKAQMSQNTPRYIYNKNAQGINITDHKEISSSGTFLRRQGTSTARISHARCMVFTLLQPRYGVDVFGAWQADCVVVQIGVRTLALNDLLDVPWAAGSAQGDGVGVGV